MTKKTVEEAAPVDKTKKAKEQLKLVNAQLTKLKSVKAVQNYVKAAKIRARLLTKISGAKERDAIDAENDEDGFVPEEKQPKGKGDGFDKAMQKAEASLLKTVTSMDAAGRKKLWDKWLEWFDYADDGQDVPKYATLKNDPKKIVAEMMNSDPIAEEGGLLDFIAGAAKDAAKGKPAAESKPAAGGKKTSIDAAKTSDKILLTLAKACGLDDKKAFNAIWDAKKLTSAQRLAIVKAIHAAGYSSYTDNGKGLVSPVK